MAANKSVGIIGAGSIVFKSHLPLLKAMGWRVPWLLDVQKDRAKAAANAYGVPVAMGADELANAPAADIILMACPYGTRKPYYEYLRGSGAALFIEKPVARTVTELENIRSLRADHAIAAGFSRRSMGVTRTMKNLIEDKLFGQLRRIRSEFGSPTIISTGAGFAKKVELAGGGQLFESAIHNIDSICYMAGIERATVKACKMIHENGFDLHTEANLQLTDGAGREIEFELLVTCFRHTRYEIEMDFDHARLVFSLFKPMLPTVRTAQGRGEYTLLDSRFKDHPSKSYDVLYAFWTDFLRALEQGQANYTNLCATLVTTSIIEQLYAAGGAKSN